MMLFIGIADDHDLFLRSLALLIDSFPGMQVIVQAINGEDLLKKLDSLPVQPQILLTDMNMPVMNGLKTVEHISRDHPEIRTVALSMKEDDEGLIRMLMAGCCGWWLKDIHPDELETAIRQVHEQGFYNADAYNVAFRRAANPTELDTAILLNDGERRFMRAVCSDLSWEEIALKMGLSPGQMDDYRDRLFDKFHVRSRVGLALEGIRRKLASP